MFERTPGWPPLQLEARRPAVATSMVKRLASIEYAIANHVNVSGVSEHVAFDRIWPRHLDFWQVIRRLKLIAPPVWRHL